MGISCEINFIDENPTKEQLMTITMQDIGIKLKNPEASQED